MMVDLVPLPQPERTKREPYKPNFSSLPPWLSKPIIVDSHEQKPFSELGLSAKVLSNLDKRGLKEAFPVQSALLPLQLPGIHRYHGDICVSAPTGSGKTLGYILPLIEALKNKVATRLRAVIVVPTRELVIQARHEAEQCAAGTKIKIGTALGSTNLVAEREQLIFRDQKYDPDEASKIRKVVQDRLETGFMEDDTLLEDVRDLLPLHVPDFASKVDILICTPGRLVDHIRSTTGFSLRHVQNLVIDEADRLLDESFQDWVDVILSALEPGRKIVDGNLISSEIRLLQQPRYVQKVILSATMTRDLAKLAALKLTRPTLVAVVGMSDISSNGLDTGMTLDTTGAVELLELPSSLREVAIPVGDGAEKPLYLLTLLDNELNFQDLDNTNSIRRADKGSTSTIPLSQSSNPSGRSDANGKLNTSISDDQHIASSAGKSRVLVFTNNNEDAMRLSHIISTMRPELIPKMGTLTKTTSKSGRKTLSAFKAGKIALLIASDRASRGLDVPDLTDVISYDMPRSETLYIHRVGRTARAGHSGTAWTFFTDPEARWFWNSIARTPHIQRYERTVERQKMHVSDSSPLRSTYESALESLKEAVLQNP
jgi:ATP-dependent RNA helicase DDX51/DBP6